MNIYSGLGLKGFIKTQRFHTKGKENIAHIHEEDRDIVTQVTQCQSRRPNHAGGKLTGTPGFKTVINASKYLIYFPVEGWTLVNVSYLCFLVNEHGVSLRPSNYCWYIWSYAVLCFGLSGVCSQSVPGTITHNPLYQKHSYYWFSIKPFFF